MILRRVLIEVFERGKGSRHLLHLVENEQRIVSFDLVTGIKLQPHNEAIGVQV